MLRKDEKTAVIEANRTHETEDTQEGQPLKKRSVQDDR